MQRGGIFLKRIMLFCIPVIIFSFLVSGCNQKVEHQVQTNTPQLKLPTQTSLPKNNSNHIIVKPTVKRTTPEPIPELNNIKNTMYPDVVAEVGDTKITGLQLTMEEAIKRNNYVYMKKPQNQSFYEKVALGQLITNDLIDTEIKKQGITATDDEIKSSIEQDEKFYDSLPDNAPAKITFMQTIKADGFNSITDYMNSPKTINAVKKTLATGKLRNIILQSVPNGQNEPAKAWDDYIDKLINEGNYKIFIPVDIKGYQQIEQQVDLGN
jgi:hypothetical protein